MILERQPPRNNLIETAFIKCEAEVAKKKMKAAKAVKRSPYRWSKDNPIEPHEDKWPPDPPKANTVLKNQLRSNFSVVEPPLAINNESNSHLVSASTKICMSVHKKREEITTRLKPKRELGRKEGKDPDAVEWEPPQLAKEQ